MESELGIVLRDQQAFLSLLLTRVALVDGEIDKAATDRLRAKRPETKAFHRHAYVDSLG